MRPLPRPTWGVPESLALTRVHVDSLCHCRVFPSTPSGTPHPYRPAFPSHPGLVTGRVMTMSWSSCCGDGSAKRWEPSLPANVLKESQTRSHVRRRLSGKWAIISCVTKTPFSNHCKLIKQRLAYIIALTMTKPLNMKHLRFSLPSSNKGSCTPHMYNQCLILTLKGTTGPGTCTPTHPSDGQID